MSCTSTDDVKCLEYIGYDTRVYTYMYMGFNMYCNVVLSDGKSCSVVFSL